MHWIGYNLRKAVRLSDLKILQRLINEGANINEFDRYAENSTIHYATMLYSLPVVQFLLENGADLSIKDTDKGETPLHYLSNCRHFYYDLVKLLLEKGANCHDRNNNGDTVLSSALRVVCLDHIKLLLEYGADITEVDEARGMTALHHAAKNSHPDVIKFVLDQGMDVNCANNDDQIPLHYAAQSGNIEGCKILLSAGAMINKRSGVTGKTPLDFVIDLVLTEDGKLEESLTNLLIQHMAKMQALNSSMDDGDRQIIEGKPNFEQYYRTCLQELELMKRTKFYNNVSVFSISTESDKVVSGFARNEQLVKAFDEAVYSHQFPVYFDSIRDKIYSKARTNRMQQSVANILSDLFKFNDPSHIINRKIINYLSGSDVKFLQAFEQK